MAYIQNHQADFMRTHLQFSCNPHVLATVEPGDIEAASSQSPTYSPTPPSGLHVTRYTVHD